MNTMNIKNKLLIHFNTNDIIIYNLKDNKINTLDNKYVNFEENDDQKIILEKINKFLNTLEKYTDIVDNQHIRLYATGIFQKFTQSEQDKLVNSIFIDYGLYFNIVQQDLEQFYLEKSVLIGESKI